MATLTELISEVAADVLALPGGTKVRPPSDYDERSPVAVGSTGIQVRASLLSVAQPDSGAPLEAAQVEVFVVRRLDTAESERAYVDGHLAADQSALISHAFWQDMAAVHSFIDNGEPGVNRQPEKIGPLVIYSVLARVALTP